jgi:NADH-quinone oxidoreductase subunit L
MGGLFNKIPLTFWTPSPASRPSPASAGYTAQGFGALVARIQSGNIRSYAGWLAFFAALLLAVSYFGWTSHFLLR